MLDRPSDSNSSSSSDDPVLIGESHPVEVPRYASPEAYTTTSSNNLSARSDASNTQSAEYRDPQQLTFEFDLWDQLPEM